MAQAVIHWPLEAQVQSQACQCGICGGQSDNGTDFSPGTSVFPCQYNFTSAPYLLIRLSWTQSQ
jgi:hypothetical protein